MKVLKILIGKGNDINKHRSLKTKLKYTDN